jgi:hypothetical protein
MQYAANDAGVADTGVPPDAGYTNLLSLGLGGTDEYVDFNDLVTDGIARAVWSAYIYQEDCVSAETLMSKWLTGGNMREWLIRTNVSGATCNLVIITTADGLTSSTWTSAAGAISENTWHHVCVSYDGSQATNATKLRTYLNGVEITGGGAFTGGAQPTTLYSGTGDFMIGALTSGAPNQFWLGSVDEIAIWTDANPPSCATIYNAGVLMNPVSFSPAPLYCYNMEGDTANTITNKCAGGLNGTMVNMEAGDLQSTPRP